MNYTEIVMALSEHRKTKPRTLIKRFGINGPNEEQLQQHLEDLRKYNKEYRRLQKLLLELKDK